MPAQPMTPLNTLTLKDGTPLTVRALRFDDQARLLAFFQRLSPESIFYRVLEYRTAITEAEVRQLCDIDGEQRMALVATRDGDAGEDLLAVARYGVIEPGQPDTAEAAIIVEDAWQGRGLGGQLLRQLTAYARAHGIRRFAATVHTRNTPILRFIERSGLRVERRLTNAVWEITIDLDSPR